MQHYNLQTEWQGGGRIVKMDVPILFFEEENIHYAYIPSFDLTGYGNTRAEAHESIKTVLDEFLRYTTNKNTLLLEMKRLGWRIRKKSKMTAPLMSDLVNTNEQLREIVNHKQYSTSKFQVDIPAFA
ncbi:MAG: hypothetical protein ABIN67_13660 [Ferruginibacter sp.]